MTRKKSDATLLKQHEYHSNMAEKHRAHADLIEARLRVAGKRIHRPYSESGRAVKARVVPSK